MLCCVVGSFFICGIYQLARTLKSIFAAEVAENKAEQWQLYPPDK